MSQNSEEILLKQLQDSSTRDSAFATLLKRYGSKIYWHIRRIVVCHEDAEDAMQETSINIYRSIANFKGESSLSTWIYRIATNEALKILRSRNNDVADEDVASELLQNKVVAESSMDAEKIEILFQQALLTLPTQQRIAFNMRYYDELSYEEIAQITGKNVGTLKTNYHFAVEKIKKFLKENS
ncbi:MAG: RNA polymerase sigma factor [Muribaculaceae bacterium]|nr:RNA polymerase sigma factor [Muribaculaceae bacterium]